MLERPAEYKAPLPRSRKVFSAAVRVRGFCLLFSGSLFTHLAGPLYSVFLKHNLLCVSLKALSKQPRGERHVIWLNPRDSEVTQEKPTGFSEALYEHIVGRPISQNRARVAVQVAQRQVNRVLSERVETRSVLQNAPKVTVRALDVGFLAGGVGIAVEKANAARGEFIGVVFRIRTVIFNHFRVGKFATIVGQYYTEKLHEQLWSGNFPEIVEDPHAGCGSLTLAEKGEHQTSWQIDCKEQFAPGLSNYGVDLGVFFNLVDTTEFDKLLVSTPDTALGVGLGDGFSVPRPSATGLR